MSDQPAPEQVIVPIKVTQPEEGAPPTLAQPVSGPVAEMSGAIHTDAPKPTEPADNSTADVSIGVNGDSKADDTSKDKAEEKPAPDSEAASIATEKPSEDNAPVADADTEMTDAGPPAAPEANGTPAAKPQPKRKSSAGVPEHKSKTLKKKQSKAKITNLDAKPGDLFMARLRSFPPWPSVIADEAMLPDVLLTTRPVTAQKQDGTYNEAYDEGGKKVADRTYPVMFLHTNEFAWIPNTDLTPTTPEECKDVSEKGKSKALVEAYKVATEGHDLDHYKQMLLEHDAAMQEDAAARAEKEAEKTAKSEKKKRKSEVKPAEDVEMEDATDAPKKSSKKRKKDAESEDEEQPEKPAKTPKTKLKFTTGKTPTTDKKTEKKTPKPKSEKKKKAADSEEDAEPEKEAAAPADPVQEKKDREKEVLFHRHKLQKGFLTRDQIPAESEMPQMATYFKKLEAYGDKLEVSIIRSTKINKVLKGIVKLNTIPKDEEYHFRERSVALLGIWNQLLGAEPTDAEKPAKEDKASPAAANGVHKEVEEKIEEKIETEVTEPKENTLPAEDAVNKISAEVPADAGDKTAAIEEISKDEKPSEETKIESADIPGTEKAPESAEAAAEATEVVKATE